MNTDRKWVVVRIDGKIAAISTDYRLLAEISARIAGEGQSKKGKGSAAVQYERITAESVAFGDVWEMRRSIGWDDLMLFGTDFQKRVWKKLWELTHTDGMGNARALNAQKGGMEKDSANVRTEDDGKPRLICYSDFAGLCENRAGVRAVAHAIGLNPVSVIIPCHLVIPKESIDRIRETRRKAETTIFKGDDLCIESVVMDPAIDFGNYALGRELKRSLIRLELFGN